MNRNDRLLVDTLDDVGLVLMHARAEAHGWPIDALEGELAKRGLSYDPHRYDADWIEHPELDTDDRELDARREDGR